MRATGRGARLAAAAAATVAAAALTAGSGAGIPGIPSIYVTYNDDCTFSMSADPGVQIAAKAAPGPTLAPGVYQLAVLMGNPSSGYPCTTPRFELSGPGVDTTIVFPGQATNENVQLPPLQPSSTYIAQELSAPSTRIYFTTAASGTATAPATPGGSAGGKTSTQPDIVGSGLLPLRGQLAGTVGANGAPSLSFGGHPASALAAGRYDLTIDDRSSAAAFVLARSGRKGTPLTGVRFVGRRTVRVTLVSGRWTYAATGHVRIAFTVT